MQSNINYISTEKILPNVYQPRKFFDEESIDELAQSINVYGIIQPLSVRRIGEEVYELVAGERRLRAAKKIGLMQVPAVIIDISDKDSAVISLLENLQRENLNFLEEAEAYFNLIKDHEFTQEQLSTIIGKKQSTIANKIRLLRLNSSIRKSILDNNLTERHARALLKLPNPQIQSKILSTVIKKSLNVKNTEELIERQLNKMSSTPNDIKKKKIIKGIFSPKVYVNTVKQVFSKYGIEADFSSKEFEEYISITINIPKK